ncbi:MAG TPA: Uma2 family endonuclease [Bryobacteraceae bacterium]
MAAIINTAHEPLVSVEEYIARFAQANEKPRCEYVDGELIPKPMHTKNHSQVQANIIRARWPKQFNPLPELSTRLREKRFYIPDIAVEDKAKPIVGRYPDPNDPVPLCIEILSPPDRVAKLFAKCEEYHRWGVPFCWIIDPDRKKAWEYFPEDREPRLAENQLTAGEIALPLAEVFEGI